MPVVPTGPAPTTESTPTRILREAAAKADREPWPPADPRPALSGAIGQAAQRIRQMAKDPSTWPPGWLDSD
jgi:hypothetical protein